ncbi:hypothetical protein PG994_008140 [Apiospora phragmitis]|uniref:Uncharacterized protein n=1 Tax=Apiospora phragmitis TaxID=2905665 RepID=A0ABR1UVA9_9PEZI
MASYAQRNAAAWPIPSGGLTLYSQRRRALIRKCEPIIAEFLASTPACAGLNAAQKGTDFMHSRPGRTVYPMKEAVRAILNTIFNGNVNLFGVPWTAGMFGAA